MAVLEGGTSAALAGVGAQVASGLHTINKPTDHGALGHYQVAVLTGTMAAGIAANAEILQFRWTDATRYAVIKEVSIQSLNSLTAFAAGFGQVDLTLARGFSAAGTGGGTVTLTTDEAQLRTSMGTSLVGEIRLATTAALTAGTKTLDTNRLSYCRFQVDATANKILVGASGASATSGQIVQDFKLWNCDIANGEYPIVLAQNEGFVIRVTVPATGTWTAYLKIKWAEVTAF